MADQLLVDTVDLDYESLTEPIAERSFRAYHSPLAGKGWGKALVEIWTSKGVSAWIGLAIIQQETSYCVKGPKRDIDERNLANPFGARFGGYKKGHKFHHNFKKEKRAKNLILFPDHTASYVNKDHPEWSVEGYRLPTMRESVENAANRFKEKGWDYNETPEAYRKAINRHLVNLFEAFEIKRQGKGQTKPPLADQTQQQSGSGRGVTQQPANGKGIRPPSYLPPWVDLIPECYPACRSQPARWPRPWVDIIPESYLNPRDDPD